ncbi:von Willebrand factor type A domain containing protein [Histomonas meleagridis]|uniref:von Willebrand factor type A domain containing protein n=1 Tax=Histomonas meleagridis TaxID=135588 RepID=UPI003559BC56|nr:von Willebrand factor type A domain containing protein [Histomonas meleagridis]KAH0797703.1 von Willebrand factor type A domain containing protein [Histomonas meleagridis]
MFGYFQITNPTKSVKVPTASIIVEGEQRGLIADLKFTQVINNDSSSASEIQYIFPTDNKICIYKAVFYVGNEVIPLKLQSEDQAKETYNEAKKQGKTAALGREIEPGYNCFSLGNVPSGIPVKVEFNCSFEANLESPQTVFVKFPFEAKDQHGRVTNLFTSKTTFNFTLKINQPTPIKDVSVNCSHTFTKTDDNNGTLKITTRPSDNTALYIRVNLNSAFPSIAYSTPTYTAICFVPDIQSVTNGEKELIFIIDCSGSMSGSRIAKAKECLDIFLHSLPTNCTFNIIRFGSRIDTLFPQSVQYNEENFNKASHYVQNMKADLGGTNILPALHNVFSQQTTKQRQLFILTDGEVNNQGEVYAELERNVNTVRCFTIGLGSGADAGLVERIANITGGKSDFVDDKSDLSMKVIPQLRLSLSESVNNSVINIENVNSFEVTPFPIPSILPNTSKTIFINKKIDNNTSLLITSKYNNEEIDFPIEINEVQWDSECIKALFSYEMIRKLELTPSINDSLKQKIINLSIDSGIISKFTSYIGVTLNQYYHSQFRAKGMGMGKPQMMMCNAMSMRCANASLETTNAAPMMKMKKCTAMPQAMPQPMHNAMKPNIQKKESKKLNTEEEMAPKKESDFRCVVSLQKIDGHWEMNENILTYAGLSSKPNIEGVNDDNVLATVIVIAAFRKKELKRRPVWEMMEEKSLAWLQNQNKNMNWNEVIEKVVNMIK